MYITLRDGLKIIWKTVNLLTFLIPDIYYIFPKKNLVYTHSHKFYIFSNYFVSRQILKYLVKYFGPSTRVSKFLTHMPQLLLSKFASQLKLIQSVVGIGCQSQDTRNLCHKFNSQCPGLRVLGLRVEGSKPQGPECQDPGSQILFLDYSLIIDLNSLLEIIERVIYQFQGCYKKAT